MKSRNYTLVEHKSIYISPSGKYEKSEGNIGLPQRVFSEVEEYISRHIIDSSFYLVPGYSRIFGKVLKAQQYVGVIETSNGIVIEVLPKIGRSNPEEIRSVLLKMLRCLRSSPFKNFNQASLSSSKMNILEIFITMFCEELSQLVKKGIKSDYLEKVENSKFLKGKLRTSDHLKKNLIHKEKFFIEYDDYKVNRVENRIIKTTLSFLYNKSNKNFNKKRIREFLFVFDEVDELPLPIKNFNNMKLNRQTKDYGLVLEWCKIFLRDSCITSLKGNTKAFALFFDMNLIFEDYVAKCLRRSFPEKDIKTQVTGKYLIEGPKKEFKLIPDILIDDNVIADTKWKLLDSSKPHNGISQSDIYQMYAYCKKYDVEEVNLIYPYTEDFPEISNTSYTFEEGHKLRILAFNCKRGEIV